MGYLNSLGSLGAINCRLGGLKLESPETVLAGFTGLSGSFLSFRMKLRKSSSYSANLPCLKYAFMGSLNDLMIFRLNADKALLLFIWKSGRHFLFVLLILSKFLCRSL